MHSWCPTGETRCPAGETRHHVWYPKQSHYSDTELTSVYPNNAKHLARKRQVWCLSHSFDSTSVRTHEVRIPCSPKTGDGRSIHSAILSGLITWEADAQLIWLSRLVDARIKLDRTTQPLVNNSWVRRVQNFGYFGFAGWPWHWSSLAHSEGLMSIHERQYQHAKHQPEGPRGWESSSTPAYTKTSLTVHLYWSTTPLHRSPYLGSKRPPTQIL